MTAFRSTISEARFGVLALNDSVRRSLLVASHLTRILFAADAGEARVAQASVPNTEGLLFADVIIYMYTCSSIIGQIKSRLFSACVK
jgi:hypothetical protein